LDCLEPHRAAKFIHTDVPKRFALRIRMIESLVGWQSVPELVTARDKLYAWYRELRLIERGSHVGLADFTASVKNIN